MLLNEVDIFLGVFRQLLKAPHSRGVALPARQRLILDLHTLQHLLIGWHRIDGTEGEGEGERGGVISHH